MSILQISNPYTGQIGQELKKEEWDLDWQKLGELQITPKQIADRMEELLQRLTQDGWQTIDRVSLKGFGVRGMRSSTCPFGCAVEGKGPRGVSFKNLETNEELSILNEQIHVIRQHADFHLKAGLDIQEVHLNPEFVIHVLGVKSGKSYEIKTRIVEEVFWKWIEAKTENDSTLRNSLESRYGSQAVRESHYTKLHGRKYFLLEDGKVLHIVNLSLRKEAEPFSAIHIEFKKMEEATIQVFHKETRNATEEEFSDGSKRRKTESEESKDVIESSQKKRKIDPEK